MAALRLHPFAQVSLRDLDVVERHQQFDEQRLEGRAVAVVAVDRVDQRGAVFLEQARELFEIGAPRGVARFGVGQIGGFLAIEAGLEFGGQQGFGEGQGGGVHGESSGRRTNRIAVHASR